MAYEIIALDLDGTLTNSKKEITDPTRDAIIDIMKHGKKVVLASGRPTAGIVPLTQKLHFKDYAGYVINYNGGRILDCHTGKVIHNKMLPENTMPDVYNIARQFDVDFLTYTDTHILCNKAPNEYTVYESHTEGMDIIVDENLETLDIQVNKCLFAGDPLLIAEIEQILKDRFQNLYSICRSEPFFVEIMPQNVDKAEALQMLLKELNLTREQLICCGDGYNDIPMIEYAGLGVAMANAQPELKEKADYITKSNDEDGVLHVINQFMR